MMQARSGWRGRRGDGYAAGTGRWIRRAGTGAVVLGLAVTAAACTDREVTRPDAAPVTQEGLAAAALDVDDLPGQPSASPPGASGGVGAELLDHPCDDVLSNLSPALEADSTHSTDAVQISSHVAWFPGGGQAAANVFGQVRDRCREAADTASGLSIRASSLRFGALTDRVLPIKLELEPATGPITEIAVIVAREGDLLHVIRASGERPIDRELLDAAARAALGKLSALALETGQ